MAIAGTLKSRTKDIKELTVWLFSAQWKDYGQGLKTFLTVQWLKNQQLILLSEEQPHI